MERQGAIAKECGDESAAAGRGPGQLEWYRFAARFVQQRSVLDVGCGTGKGLEVLRGVAASAHGQDLDERLRAPDVKITDLAGIPDKSYDVVTTIDVVEHVQTPEQFVRDLARIARLGFFLTTPNWTASRCEWPYHLREYTPREFSQLLEPCGHVTLFKGESTGLVVHEVRFPRALYLFNDLRTWPVTAFGARCFNRVVPGQFKIFSHLAAWVTVPAIQHG